MHTLSYIIILMYLPLGWNGNHRNKILRCIIIPEKSVIGFCPPCVCAQYQACPPISRPPPAATKSWISSTWSPLYAVHTNTLRSFLKSVFSHLNPDLLRTLRAWSGTTPTTPCRPSSNQWMTLFQNGASVCNEWKNGMEKQTVVNHVKQFGKSSHYFITLHYLHTLDSQPMEFRCLYVTK